MLRLISFLVVQFFLGAEAGASFSWSSKWQNKKFLGSFTLNQLPEALDALLLGFFAMQGYQNLGLDLSFFWEVALFAGVVSVIYAGIQSATWTFLQWEGHNNPETTRSSTLKPFVDIIANKLGYKLGDEGYSWVSATVKGTIITLPMGGLGGILFALGYEIGSHAKGRVDKWLNPHIIAEGMSFVGVGFYVYGFLEITKIFTGA